MCYRAIVQKNYDRRKGALKLCRCANLRALGAAPASESEGQPPLPGTRSGDRPPDPVPPGHAAPTPVGLRLVRHHPPNTRSCSKPSPRPSPPPDACSANFEPVNCAQTITWRYFCRTRVTRCAMYSLLNAWKASASAIARNTRASPWISNSARIFCTCESA
jgi:hypothetical protein